VPTSPVNRRPGPSWSAAAQLGSAVSVYLDAGPSGGGLASTILDCTDEAPVILRAGALSVSQIQQVLGDIELRN